MEKAISKIKFAAHNKTFLKHLILGIKRKSSEYINIPEKRESYKLKYYFNYKVNYTNPTSFNEYLLWIKHNYENQLWKDCADKLKVKEILSKWGFGNNVPKTLGVYNSSSEINLNELPNRFVLKTNHDSGSVFVCDKSKTDFTSIFNKLDESLKTNYSKLNYEWFYEDIKPLIFAEELLIPAEDIDINDYKLFIFDGKFRFGFTAVNRQQDVRFQLFDDGFNLVACEYTHLRPSKSHQINKPTNFDEMVKLAESVGKHFDFVRVDLYNTTKGIMIGELTFCSMSGFGAFTKKEYDFKYGEYFKDTIFYDLAHK